MAACGRCCRIADARPGPRDTLVHPVVRRLGPLRRTRVDLHRSLQVERVADGVPGGGAGAAGFVGAPPDGHADGSIRRTPGLHGASRLLLACRVRRADDRQLRLAPGSRVPPRHGRVILRGGRGLRVPLDACGSPGHGARRLRPWDDGAIAGRLRRPAGGSSPGLGSGVPGHERAPPWLGGRVLRVRAESAACRASGHGCRDDGRPAARAHRLAARRLLLPDIRRLRRVLGLSADAAACAVRPGPRGRRIPGGWIRRARHAHAARRWVAGGPDRRRSGPVVGLRGRRPVLAAPDVALDGAVHGRRARVRDVDGTGERGGLQAGAGALPERHRHGDRPRRRPRRPGRVLPSASARRLQRSHRGHLARVPPLVRDRPGAARSQSARVPPRRRRMDAVLAGGRASGARARQSRRVGGARHGHVGGGDRRRVAKSAALRRGARRLHVRDTLCGVRDQLSVRDVAAASADADVLASRVAGLLFTARVGRQHRQPGLAARCWSLPPTRTSSGAAGSAGSRTG